MERNKIPLSSTMFGSNGQLVRAQKNFELHFVFVYLNCDKRLITCMFSLDGDVQSPKCQVTIYG